MKLPHGILEALERSRAAHPEIPVSGAVGHRVVLPSGAASRWRYDPNGVTIEALQMLLQVGYMGAGQLAQIFPWYGGLIDSSGFTTLASTDTHGQIDGTNQWVEETQYETQAAVAERVQWVVAAPTGSNLFLTNVASPMAFVATAALAVKGSFLASTKVFGPDAGEFLNSTSLFSEGDRSVADGSTLELTWTFALAIG